MVRRMVVLLVVVGGLAGCDQGQKEAAWKHEVDSLRTQLALSTEAMETLGEVGALIDSIDNSRQVVRSGIAEGLPQDVYTARLFEINEYVKASQLKIEDLDRELRKHRSSNSRTNAALSKMKKDLQAKSDELILLAAELNRYKYENDSLNNTVSVQTAELNDKLEQLTARQEEIAKLENEVKEISAQAKFDLAESYYLRAQALEEAAKRTNFAPKKKKSTRSEALELYRLAALSGKEEAEQKVQELENK
jgi:hypothetical protein